MTPSSLLSSLRAAGFDIRPDGERLLVTPGSKLSAEQRQEIAHWKESLMVLADPEHEAKEAAVDELHASGWLPSFEDGPVQLVEIALVDVDGRWVALPAADHQACVEAFGPHNAAALARKAKEEHRKPAKGKRKQKDQPQPELKEQ